MQLLRASINIESTDYDKITTLFYRVNYRRHNRRNCTSIYDAKDPSLGGLPYDYQQRSAIGADSFNSYFANLLI